MPVRQNARPRHAEAVRLNSQLAHQPHVLRKTPVVIAGHVAIGTIGNFAGRMREAMPDARAGAVGQRRAFDLVGAGGCAPEKSGGKFGVGQRGISSSPPSRGGQWEQESGATDAISLLLLLLVPLGSTALQPNYHSMRAAVVHQAEYVQHR